ncbi:hypothetical protein V8E54_009126 [Elaphomyces granulatus]
MRFHSNSNLSSSILPFFLSSSPPSPPTLSPRVPAIFIFRSHLEHATFYRIFDYKARDGDITKLTHPMDSVNCLSLDSKAPPWVHHVYAAEIETHATSPRTRGDDCDLFGLVVLLEKTFRLRVRRSLSVERVRNWDHVATARQLRDLGVEAKHCDIFEQQEITGDVLLDMDQEFILMKDFDFGVMGKRLKTWHTIKAFQSLQAACCREKYSQYATTDADTFELLHRKYWGKGEEGWKTIYKRGNITVPPLDLGGASTSLTLQEPEAITENLETGTDYEFLDLGPGFESFFAGNSTMLIRREYRETLNHITELYKIGHGGAVLTGQPGVGNTIFLYYVLVCRVLNAEVTAFEDRSDQIYLFGPSFESMQTISSRQYPGAWALSDSNDALIKPNQSFTLQGSCFFTLQATSPQPKWWHGWPKYRDAAIVAMDLWSWTELYIGATQFRFKHKPINDEFCEVLKHVFLKYSRSARAYYTFVRNVKTIDDVEDSPEVTGIELSINEFVKHPPDTWTLRLLASERVGAGLKDSDIVSQSSDNVIAIRPDKDRRPSFTFSTRYIAESVSRGLEDRNAEEFWEMDVGMSCATSARKGDPRAIIEAVIQRAAGDEDSAHYRDRKSLTDKLSNFVFSTKKSIFLQPGSRNQATFDAFSISRDGIVTIFQMTVRENHSIKASGLDFIWDAIRDAEKMADSAWLFAFDPTERA